MDNSEAKLDNSVETKQSSQRRMGFFISDEAFNRVEAIKLKYRVSQGVAIERIVLALTDEELDRILKDSSKALTKRDVMKAINSMTEEQIRQLAQSILKA